MKTKEQKLYLVFYMTETDGEPVCRWLSGDDIRAKFKSQELIMEGTAIVDARELIKDFQSKRDISKL